MKSALEIKKMRSGKGFFSRNDVIQALEKEGCNMTVQALFNKEHGKSPFTSKEIKVMSKIYEISLEEAYEFFCE